METINTDVLIIGAGAAGIRAALAASEVGADVLVATKGPVTKAGSTFSPVSQGWGIQALVGDERNDQNLGAFYNDVMKVGLGRCDPRLVRILVEESAPRLEDLISYGVRFKKDANGNYLRVKGCFSAYKRAFLTETMNNIKTTFANCLERSNVRTITGIVLDLAVVNGTCWGGWVLTDTNDVLQIKARATVLATGGAAGIFTDHLVRDEAVGDGYALAHRAGAELTNLEFIQFMLGLKTGSIRHFLPLGRLGNGGVIKDDQGQDLLEGLDWDAETRFEVLEERRSHFPFSCRDNSHRIDIAVADACKQGRRVQWKDAVTEEQLSGCEVVHLAHAFNGGVRINEKAESTIPGLFAAGEVAAGPHGADRIGGCMMTATQVFGKRAGEFAAKRAKMLGQASFPEILPDEDVAWIMGCEDTRTSRFPLKVDVGQQVKKNLERYAMVLRSGEGLINCKKTLEACESLLQEMRQEKTLPPLMYLEWRNMVVTGKLVVENCCARKQSLGPHYREDYPPTDCINNLQ